MPEWLCHDLSVKKKYFFRFIIYVLHVLSLVYWHDKCVSVKVKKLIFSPQNCCILELHQLSSDVITGSA